VYSEDGEPRDFPDYSTISRRRNLVTTTLELNTMKSISICLPDDVDSEAKAEGIFGLMRTIAETLKKRVLLTAENAGATQQWSEEHAICAFDPPAQL